MLTQLVGYGAPGLALILFIIVVKSLWPQIMMLVKLANGKGEPVFNAFTYELEQLKGEVAKLGSVPGDISRLSALITGISPSSDGGILGEISSLRKSRHDLANSVMTISSELAQMKLSQVSMVSSLELERAIRKLEDEIREEFVGRSEIDIESFRRKSRRDPGQG